MAKMWLKLAAGLAAMAALAALPEDAFAADAAHPTVIEIFQSQGCSDCPPAEANVAAVSDRADVLALAFEVDYWDRLGWKDTFSKPEWTARQYAYARSLKSDGVYTPQVIVNGRAEGDGLEPAGLAELMRRGDRGPGGPPVSFAGGALRVGEGEAPPGGADVWLIRYILRTVEVAIRRGENSGRTLPYRNIVREMVRLGRWTGEAASFPLPGGGDPDLAEAAIMQAAAGPIIAAAKR